MRTSVRNLTMNLSNLLTERQNCLLICLLLILGVWLGFGRAIEYDFVNYDDDVFVYNNSLVVSGLTAHGLVEVLTRIDQISYYPLCTISFMLDSTLYGLNPSGFHLTNVLLHMANAILLFLVLRGMTGSVWRSALVAAFFAVHPLRAESVVWITERKDVLSGFFFLLTLRAYLSYVRRPFSLVRYAAVFLLYLAGQMSKPMLVSLPFVLLLLDFWPLRRFQTLKAKKTITRLILEKIPLLMLAAVFCGITAWAQRGAISSDTALSVPWRLGNAFYSYAIYIKQLILPVGLAPFYPHQGIRLPLWKIGISVALLAGISWGVFAGRKKYPHLITGWLWYLGMLVPVIGIMQVGLQSHADRYTYLPQIGLVIMAAWCVAVRRRVWLSSVLVVMVFVGLAAVARRQSAYWCNSETIWTHTLAVTDRNFVAHSNLGSTLLVQGRTKESIRHFEQAIELGAKQAQIYNNLGFALADTGDYEGAVRQYLKALSIDPDRAEILKNLADAFSALGDTERAIRLYELAIDQSPDSSDALQGLAWILAAGSNASFRNGARAVALAEKSDTLCCGRDVSVLCTLAAAYAEAGRFPMAVTVAHRALALAVERKDSETVERIRQQLGLYERQEPYHELPGKGRREKPVDTEGVYENF